MRKIAFIAAAGAASLALAACNGEQEAAYEEEPVTVDDTATDDAADDGADDTADDADMDADAMADDVEGGEMGNDGGRRNN